MFKTYGFKQPRENPEGFSMRENLSDFHSAKNRRFFA